MRRKRLASIFAVFALALWPSGLRAGVVHTAPLYAAPHADWSGAIGGALGSRFESAYAPIVRQLVGGFDMTPAAFKALPLEERREMCDLAVGAARDDLSRDILTLRNQALSLAAPGRALSRKERAELYRIVAHLEEIKRHYGPLFREGESETVSESYGWAVWRAWEIAQALRRGAQGMADELDETGRARLAAEIAALSEPTRAAREAAADMRNNPYGRTQRELRHLLTGHGFKATEGDNHPTYRFPGLRRPMTLSHHRGVDADYHHVAMILEVIDESLRLRASAAPGAPPAVRRAAPARVRLGDLAILVGQ